MYTYNMCTYKKSNPMGAYKKKIICTHIIWVHTKKEKRK